MAIAICGLFFGLVISPKSQNQNLPTGSIQKKNAKHSFFSSKFREHPSPKKKQTSIETIRKKKHLYHPTWRKKTCTLPVSLRTEVAGDLFVDNKRAQISNRKTKILHQQSTFTVFPPGNPHQLGSVEGYCFR